MNGHVQRDDLFQRRARDGRRHAEALSTSWAARRPSRTSPPAGRWPAIRRSRGPSRSPAASAARATAWFVHWPKRIKAKGEVRTQCHHVIDIAPTILEAAGLPEPKRCERHGADARSKASAWSTRFDDRQGAATRHHTQYFEILGNRAIYHDGWLAGTVHRAPWEMMPRAPRSRTISGSFTTRATTSAWSTTWPRSQSGEAEGNAGPLPEEAVTNHVLPIDDRAIERFNPALAGRPDLMAGRTSLTVL